MERSTDSAVSAATGGGPGDDGPVRLAVIEDLALVRDGLVASLAGMGFEVVFAGPSPDGVLAEGFGENDVDVVLLDLDLGGGRHAEPSDITALVARGWRVLIVSAMEQQGRVRELLRAEVAGYVPKWEDTQALGRAIRQVAAGAEVTSRELAGIIFADNDPQRPLLSEQERTALKLYASGLKLTAVARRMNITVNTAKEYIRRVREKYAAAGRPARTKTDLYREAVRDHFLDEDF